MYCPLQQNMKTRLKENKKNPKTSPHPQKTLTTQSKPNPLSMTIKELCDLVKRETKTNL